MLLESDSFLLTCLPAMHALGWVSQLTAFQYKFGLIIAAYSFWYTSHIQCIFKKKIMIASWRTVKKISQPKFIHKNASLTKVEIILWSSKFASLK